MSLALRIIASTEIARAVCLGDFFRATEPEKAHMMWDAGVYDAGVKFFTTESRLDNATAGIVAREKSGAGVRAFGFGTCPDGKSGARSWIAFFPSAVAANVKNENLILPEAKDCTDLVVRFVGPSGPSQSVDRVSDGRWKLPRQNGIVTATCSHDGAAGKKPSRMGPELWFSIPTRQGPASTVPDSEFLKETNPPQDFKRTLATWINKVRERENLGPLRQISLADAPDLSKSATPLHDRKLMSQLAAIALKVEQLALTGEDRVLARSAQDAAWLLWNSPRHRDLLLSVNSNSILIQTTTDTATGMTTASLLLFSPISGKSQDLRKR
ncbi:hypothetical protein EBZ80_11565 [bacterium]|nr:hypothetical protein [bacterium]